MKLFNKYKIKKNIKKVFLITVISITVFVISAIPSYAVYWQGEGIVMNVYSSSFWDMYNGLVRVSPKHDAAMNTLRFEATLPSATTGTQLYMFCSLEDIDSYYGWLHFKAVAHYGAYEYDYDLSGLYALKYDSNGYEVVDFNNKILPFEAIGQSDIALHLTNRYPLPKRFCIFIAYYHYSTDNVELATFDLSYTQEYPYIDTSDFDNQIKEDDDLIKFVASEIKSNLATTDSLGITNNLTQNMQNGMLAMASLVTKELTIIPSLNKIINLSFTLGFFAFLVGLGVFSFKNKADSNDDGESLLDTLAKNYEKDEE